MGGRGGGQFPIPRRGSFLNILNNTPTERRPDVAKHHTRPARLHYCTSFYVTESNGDNRGAIPGLPPSPCSYRPSRHNDREQARDGHTVHRTTKPRLVQFVSTVLPADLVTDLGGNSWGPTSNLPPLWYSQRSSQLSERQ